MRLSVDLDDLTADAVRDSAGVGGMSSWVAAAVKQRLLAHAAEQISTYDGAHDDARWETARLEGRA